VACKEVDVVEASSAWTTERLTPGEPVEVYYWSRREWRLGSFEVARDGQAFVVFSSRTRLRFEAAQLMGLRRLLH
jgi:hypothetical protein